MSRSWLKLKNRFSADYVNGVDQFILFATNSADGQGRIRCPCRKCNNTCFKIIELVKADIFLNGMVEDYTTWIHHGEPFVIGNNSGINQPSSTQDIENDGLDTGITSMLDDMGRATEAEIANNGIGDGNMDPTLARLIKDANCPLFAKLESEFDICMDNAAMRRAINYSLSRRFVNFKHYCHEHYQNLRAGDIARQTPPEDINMDDWIHLSDHFESPRFKRQSAANKRNKSMQTYGHTTGGKSCCQRMYEMENKQPASQVDEENNGEESDEVEEEPREMKVYADTHRRSDGSWINVEPQQNYEMKRIYVEAVEEGKELSGAYIVRMVLRKAPSYARNEKESSQKEKDLEARLEKSLADGEKQRLEFEDQIQAQQQQIESQHEQIHNQQQEIQGQKEIIQELRESQNSLKNYVESLAAKIDGRLV